MQDRRMTLDRRQAARRYTTSGSETAAVSMVTSTMASLSPSRKPPPVEDALPGDGEMWEVGHVARFLKRSESWVYKKSAAGILPVHRLDGWGLRYVPDEIRYWAGQTKKKHR